MDPTFLSQTPNFIYKIWNIASQIQIRNKLTSEIRENPKVQSLNVRPYKKISWWSSKKEKKWVGPFFRVGRGWSPTISFYIASSRSICSIVLWILVRVLHLEVGQHHAVRWWSPTPTPPTPPPPLSTRRNESVILTNDQSLCWGCSRDVSNRTGIIITGVYHSIYTVYLQAICINIILVGSALCGAIIYKPVSVIHGASSV